MNRFKKILFLFLFLTILMGEISLAQEAAIELLEPGWENKSYMLESPMILYFLKMEELSQKTIKELEYRLARNSNFEDKEWMLIADQGIISSIWSGVLLELQNIQEEFNIKNDYTSWLITVPGKEGRININNTLITDKYRESPAYFRIVLKPMALTFNEEKIFTSLKLEYKDKSGNIANVETDVWLGNKSTEPVVFLKQLQEDKAENNYRYFALFIEARSLYPEMLRGAAPILVMNNIKGINQLFSLEKITVPKNQYAFYLGNNGGGIEFNRDIEGEKLNLSLFKEEDILSYQAVFDKKIYASSELSGSVLIQKSSEPYLMLGLRDSIEYFTDFKGQVYIYPLVIDLDEFNSHLPVTEILFSYEKKAFLLTYKGNYRNSEINNSIKMNYSLSPAIALSVFWKEGDYYLGVIYNK